MAAIPTMTRIAPTNTIPTAGPRRRPRRTRNSTAGLSAIARKSAISTQMITERVTHRTSSTIATARTTPITVRIARGRKRTSALVEHRFEHRRRPGRPRAASSHLAPLAPARQALAVSRPSRQSSGTGAWTAKALRRSDVNQTCSISLPCVSRDPAGQRPVACGASPRLFSPHADEVGVPALDRAGRSRAGHAARNAEHRADETGLAPGLGRVDQRLGPLGSRTRRSALFRRCSAWR